MSFHKKSDRLIETLEREVDYPLLRVLEDAAYI